jgi:hypothetical protein
VRKASPAMPPAPRRQQLLAVFALLAVSTCPWVVGAAPSDGAASPAATATVTVVDREGAPVASATVHLAEGATLPGATAMAQAVLPSGKPLQWRTTDLGGTPVVMTIAGMRCSFPGTAWVLSHVRGARTRFNVGLADVEVQAGDVLHWQLWRMADLPPLEEEEGKADAGAGVQAGAGAGAGAGASAGAQSGVGADGPQEL